jgi:hypothetical protein
MNELEPVIDRVEAALWNDAGKQLDEESGKLLKLLSKE